MSAGTVLDKLAQYVKEKPNETAFIFLRDGESDAVEMTYAELDRRARSIASSILTKMPEAKRALLLHPPGLEFVAALMGCFYAGVAAVPCYPPTAKLNSRANDRLLHLADNAQTNLALVDTSNAAKVMTHLNKAPIRLMETNLQTKEAVSDWPVVEGHDLAIIQYTSGSTGTPKGVVVRHANLMANLAAIQQAFELSERSRVVSWLPPYHDMGLIGGILSALFNGYVLIMMEPRHFLQKPVRWLQAIDRYGADTSGAPGFAYDLCSDKITSQEIASLDLSRWTLAFCGAETVRANSMRRFSETFAIAGFSQTALFATYGLAEVSLMATAPPKGQGVHMVTFDADGLEQGYARLAGGSAHGRELTSCGAAGAGISLCIIDPHTNGTCEDGRVGEICLSGASVASGYWGQSQLSEKVFKNRLAGSKGAWLRTGDLGFLWQGELFVSGRLKDLLIIRGKNFFPSDLEEVVGCCHPALALNACAAFSIEAEGGERLVLGVEVRREARATLDVRRVTQTIRATVSDIFDLSVHDILLLRPYSLARTTSGKISRSQCRKDYLQQKWKALQGEALQGNTGNSVPSDPLTTQVFTCLGRLLGVEEYTLDPSQTLGDLGIDSLKRVELSLILEELLKCRLSPEMFEAGLQLDDLIALLRTRQTRTEKAIEKSPERSAELTGDVPLTALQHAFLEANLKDADQFVEVIYLRTPRGLDVKALQTVLQDLDHRFDGLRMRFHRERGQWRQSCATLGSSLIFEHLDVSGVSVEETRATRTRMVSGLKSGFDLAHGPLAKAVLFDRGVFETGILGLSVHHLVVDVISMSLLVTALEQSYERCIAGVYETPVLEPVFVPWVRDLSFYANQIDKQELAYWQKVCGPKVSCAHDHGGERDETTRWKVSHLQALTIEENHRFFMRYTDAKARHDVLVAALASVWCEVRQQDQALIALEHHGRRAFGGGPAPWGGVGWFVYRYPVAIDAQDEGDASAWLCATEEAILHTPHQGIGYGLLGRVCADDATRRAMNSLRRPRLKVTYRGKMDEGFRKGARFSYIGREGDTTLYLKAMEKVGEDFDLELQGAQTKGALVLTIQYTSPTIGDVLVNEIKEKLVVFLREILRETGESERLE